MWIPDMSVRFALRSSLSRRTAALVAITVSASTLVTAVPAGGLSRASAASSASVSDVTSRPDAVSAMEAAKTEGHRVEVTDQDTESSTTYANPDGTFTTSTAQGPVRVRRAGGGWDPVDLNLQQTDDG